ncbi:hypothetical protein HNQ84_000350 [Anoxybacillus eryuanensis]|uniref:Uncharacterized protein n=1 Tax=Anoxybacillus tengchongensis TaxID=576944 RepID=A0A7W9YRZ1_9BACL|nr:hypothetical protein [Anoxybacillus tengchongensis]
MTKKIWVVFFICSMFIVPPSHMTPNGWQGCPECL